MQTQHLKARMQLPKPTVSSSQNKNLLYSLKNLAGIIFGVVKWPITSYKGENFHEFRGFIAIFESFLHEIGGCNVFWWQHQQPIRESFLPRKFPAIL